MTRFTRDLTVAAAIAAAIIVSLVIARVLAADTAPAPSTADQTPTSDLTVSRPPSSPDSPATTTTPAPTSDSPVVPPATMVSLVLSNGVPVVPRPDRPAQTYPSAPPPPLDPRAPSTATPDPGAFDDPAALAEAWLAALCRYDFRGERDENIRRAAAFGDTSMPPGQNPWALDDRAWARITAGHLGSGCTDISATPAHAQRNGVDQDTVTLTATQILTADGTAYQTLPVNLTRALQRGPDGRWLIGAAVTAN